MKTISIVGISIIILFLLLFFGSSVGTHYDIRYQSGKFDTSAEKKKFQEKLEKYLTGQGYRKVNKNPEWALTSFGDEGKKKINFYVKAGDKNRKSIFYMEDGTFDDNVLIIMYVYAATAHPLFIDSENERLHAFGVKIAEEFPGLTISSDSYMTMKLQE